MQQRRPRALRSEVPASPDLARQARQRLESLHRLGVSERRIAAACGLHPATVNRIRRNLIPGLKRSTAQAVLAARIPPVI